LLQVTCNRCVATFHQHCASSRQSTLKEMYDGEWACTECVAITVRRRYYPSLHPEDPTRVSPELRELVDEVRSLTRPPFLSLALTRPRVQMGEEAREMLCRAQTVISDWGPVMLFPATFDLTLNRTLYEYTIGDPNLYTLLCALSVLGAKASTPCTYGQDPSEACPWSLRDRLVVLEGLCNLAASAHPLRSYLEKQEQRVDKLRKKVPDDENQFKVDLKELGGDAALLAWKDPGGDPTLELDGADDPDQPADTCVVCMKSTTEQDENTVRVRECHRVGRGGG
jgi:hypothetical protein